MPERPSRDTVSDDVPVAALATLSKALTLFSSTTDRTSVVAGLSQCEPDHRDTELIPLHPGNMRRHRMASVITMVKRPDRVVLGSFTAGKRLATAEPIK